MSNIFIQISDLLSSGRTVALCRIIRQTGSAPRATGVNCLVLDDGSLRGTIGGGRLEFEVTTQARNNFTAGKSFLQHFELTGAEVAQTEKMICGGVVDVYAEFFTADNEAASSLFRRIGAKLREGKRGVLVTLIAEGTAGNTNCPVFLDESGEVLGTIPGLALDAEAKRRLLETRTAALSDFADTGQLFVEPVTPDNVLYLFGAGHISTCLAPLAKMIGFTGGH
jgi:xanthine dehydrogenase accessory factor